MSENINPNRPPVGDTIDALIAAAHRIAQYRNGTLPLPEDPVPQDPNLTPVQQENVSLLLLWLARAFSRLENQGPTEDS